MRALMLLAALCALVGAGCGSETAEEATAPTETMPAEEATTRQAAPPIEGMSLEGERISLAEFRGRPVFVNVWSSW